MTKLLVADDDRVVLFTLAKWEQLTPRTPPAPLPDWARDNGQTTFNLPIP